jgi:hypothetical protein
MSLHEQCVGATDEWYTPPYVFEAMGVRFDLDVAAPRRLDWIPINDRFITSGSLEQDWRGFIWMNPPFGGRNAIPRMSDRLDGELRDRVTFWRVKPGEPWCPSKP